MAAISCKTYVCFICQLGLHTQCHVAMYRKCNTDVLKFGCAQVKMGNKFHYERDGAGLNIASYLDLQVSVIIYIHHVATDVYC